MRWTRKADAKLSARKIISLTENVPRTRGRYDRQFKICAVQLWKSGGKSIAEVAGELGIAPKRRYRWKDEVVADAGNVFPGDGISRDEAKARLRKK
jgi:transposase-like protein